MSSFPVTATVAKGHLWLSSAPGICDLVTIQCWSSEQNPLLCWCSLPVLVSRASPGKMRWKAKVHPKSLQWGVKRFSTARFILANLSLARSYFCHRISAHSFQSNWVLRHLCDIFGFLWVIGIDEVRKENLQFTWKWCWGLVTSHPVTSMLNREMLQLMQNILPLFAQDLAPPTKPRLEDQ